MMLVVVCAGRGYVPPKKRFSLFSIFGKQFSMSTFEVQDEESVVSDNEMMTQLEGISIADEEK